MSGYHPFGLSALGSMSSLGSIAQSAQRLDRLNDMMSSSSRNQGSNWNRDNKQRRNMDDDFFGGGGMNRRSLSPPRHFDDDNRRHNQRRGNQRRNRGNDSFGSSGGAGILGAAPDNMPGPSLSGLSDIGGGGFSGNLGSFNDGGVSQLNSQAQQLLNVMQTQQLLAAVQAQAMSNPKPPSLMQSGPTPGFSRQGGHMNQRNRNRNDRPWHGRQRDDRKRRMSPIRGQPPKRDRRDNNRGSRFDHNKKGTAGSTDKKRDEKNKEEKSKDDRTKKNSKTETGGTKDVKEQAEKTEKKEGSSDEVIKPGQKNAAGEEVDALVKANFDGTRYWCSLCKIVCLKSKNIYKHYFSKRHVKSAVESRGEVFDPAIMKETKEENIAESFKYVNNSRKIARKENNDVVISSQHECIVTIKDFATRKSFMGSEFVKAISGFKCQLCKAFIRSGQDVSQHIQGKRHKGNYELYLKDHPNFPETQLEVNKSLVELLVKHEGKDVLLFEIKNNEVFNGAQPAEEPEKNCTLEESQDEDDVATYTMDDQPADDSKVGDDSVEHEEPSSQDDSVQEESKTSTVPDEETEEELEKSLLGEDGTAQEETKADDVQDGEVEQLLKSPVEETIPFLDKVAAIKPMDDEIEEDAEVQPEIEEIKEPEPVKEEVKFETPTSAAETSLQEDVEESPSTSRRGGKRSRGRGRGSTPRSTRGKGTRKSGRGARNAKKEEVEETNEEPPAAEEASDKTPKKATEEPPKTEQEPPEKMEEEPPKEAVEELPFFEGFEVIDEIVGGEEDDDDEEDDD